MEVKTALFLLLAGCIWADEIRVYSEFVKLDASGQVLAPESPREILSPAVVRNAYASFQIVADVAPGKISYLYLGQNPEGSFRVEVYREVGAKLEPVKLPVATVGPGVYWLDLFVGKSLAVDRFKVEPQLWVNQDWVIYPMEFRVMEAAVPEDKLPEQTLRNLMCGSKTPAAPSAAQSAGTQDAMRERNARQDAALLQSLFRNPAGESQLVQRLGSCEAEPATETYLRIRDYLAHLR